MVALMFFSSNKDMANKSLFRPIYTWSTTTGIY